MGYIIHVSGDSVLHVQSHVGKWGGEYAQWSRVVSGRLGTIWAGGVWIEHFLQEKTIMACVHVEETQGGGAMWPMTCCAHAYEATRSN